MELRRQVRSQMEFGNEGKGTTVIDRRYRRGSDGSQWIVPFHFRIGVVYYRYGGYSVT